MKPGDSVTIDARANTLLARMTLEEKIGQLLQYNGAEDNALDLLERYHVGSFLHVMGEKLEVLRAAAERSRLGIPLLFGIDAVRGHGLWLNATLFPAQLALACSWNEKLLEQVAQATAHEVRATGPQWTFSPQLDICRDIRWGRMGETFGEDSALTGALGSAMVRGYQGERLDAPGSIAACPKHLVGYGETIGARDGTEAACSDHVVRTYFLPPFRQAVEAGAATIMAAYHALNGMPCSLHRPLLSGVLRDTWGFDGVVVSDWDNIGRAVYQKRVCATLEDAAVKALQAGNDIAMATTGLAETLRAAVQSGALEEALVDAAALRVLKLKFRLGLFDQPSRRGSDPEKIRTVVGCPAHRALSLEASRQSLVLLKNNGVLPVVPAPGLKLAVVGPNADDVFGTVGGWVIGSPQHEFPNGMHDRASIVTVLDGLRARYGADLVHHEPGCAAWDERHAISPWFKSYHPTGYALPEPGGLERATRLAAESDITIAVVGDTMALMGEMNDRADMDLPGGQMDMLRAVKATGKPLVVVLLVSKPHTIAWIHEHADAILCAWNQGVEGGTAVAELISGKLNPSGKLTQSWPVSLGQQPVNYNQLPGWHTHRYVDQPIEPLYAFGYGLGYSRYSYHDVAVVTAGRSTADPLRIRFTCRNCGPMAGTEIAQIYVRQPGSGTAPVMQLVAWRRITLEPGQSVVMEVDLPPGLAPTELLVGGSSRRRDLIQCSMP